jgi:hypothetical protein
MVHEQIDTITIYHRSVVLRSRLVDVDCLEDRLTVNDCFVNTEVREYLKTTDFWIKMLHGGLMVLLKTSWMFKMK